MVETDDRPPRWFDPSLHLTELLRRDQKPALTRPVGFVAGALQGKNRTRTIILGRYAGSDQEAATLFWIGFAGVRLHLLENGARHDDGAP
jgi:hypothetical protein